MSSIQNSPFQPVRITLEEKRNFEFQLSKIPCLEKETVERGLANTLNIVNQTLEQIPKIDFTNEKIKTSYKELNISADEITSAEARNFKVKIILGGAVGIASALIVGTILVIAVSLLVAAIAIPILAPAWGWFASDPLAIRLILYLEVAVLVSFFLGLGGVAGIMALSLTATDLYELLLKTSIKDEVEKGLKAQKDLLTQNLKPEELIDSLSLLSETEFKDLLPQLNIMDLQRLKRVNKNLFEKALNALNETENGSNPIKPLLNDLIEINDHIDFIEKDCNFQKTLKSNQEFFISIIRELSPENFNKVKDNLIKIAQNHKWKVDPDKLLKFCHFIREETIKEDFFDFKFVLSNDEATIVKLDRFAVPEFFRTQENDSLDISELISSGKANPKDIDRFIKLLKKDKGVKELSLTLEEIAPLWKLAGRWKSSQVKDQLAIFYQKSLENLDLDHLLNLDSYALPIRLRNVLRNEITKKLEKELKLETLQNSLVRILKIVNTYPCPEIQDFLLFIAKDKINSAKTEEISEFNSSEKHRDLKERLNNYNKAYIYNFVAFETSKEERDEIEKSYSNLPTPSKKKKLELLEARVKKNEIRFIRVKQVKHFYEEILSTIENGLKQESKDLKIKEHIVSNETISEEETDDLKIDNLINDYKNDFIKTFKSFTSIKELHPDLIEMFFQDIRKVKKVEEEKISDDFFFKFILKGKTIQCRFKKNTAPKFFIKHLEMDTKENALNLDELVPEMNLTDKELELFMHLLQFKQENKPIDEFKKNFSLNLKQVERLWILADVLSIGEVNEILFPEYQKVINKKNWSKLKEISISQFQNCSFYEELSMTVQKRIYSLIEHRYWFPGPGLIYKLIKMNREETVHSREWGEAINKFIKKNMRAISAERGIVHIIFAIEREMEAGDGNKIIEENLVKTVLDKIRVYSSDRIFALRQSARFRNLLTKLDELKKKKMLLVEELKVLGEEYKKLDHSHRKMMKQKEEKQIELYAGFKRENTQRQNQINQQIAIIEYKEKLGKALSDGIHNSLLAKMDEADHKIVQLNPSSHSNECAQQLIVSHSTENRKDKDLAIIVSKMNLTKEEGDLFNALLKNKKLDTLDLLSSTQIERLWMLADELEEKEVKDNLFPKYKEIVDKKSWEELWNLNSSLFKNCSYSKELSSKAQKRIEELLEERFGFENPAKFLNSLIALNDHVIDSIEWGNAIAKKMKQLSTSINSTEYFLEVVTNAIDLKRETGEGNKKIEETLLEIVAYKITTSEIEAIYVLKKSDKYKKLLVKVKEVMELSELKESLKTQQEGLAKEYQKMHEAHEKMLTDKIEMKNRGESEFEAIDKQIELYAGFKKNLLTAQEIIKQRISSMEHKEKLCGLINIIKTTMIEKMNKVEVAL
jgi:hypothetical protein